MREPWFGADIREHHVVGILPTRRHDVPGVMTCLAFVMS
jgi:hypothetical protein